MPDEGGNGDADAPHPALRAVVAVPVRNEAERIGACLRALEGQTKVDPGGFGVLLFLNNCTDGTAREIEAVRASTTFPLRVAIRDFAGAHAGWARRMAMDLAAEWLERANAGHGAILTTDADSRVPADWIARNLAALDDGADAVAGRTALDPAEAARLPAALHARGRVEARYEALLLELAARLAPDPHDPWPNHWTASGASLAVRLAAYRSVGGLPDMALGEDRAFVARLRSRGARVRHDPAIVVVTSGRLQGRAPGGAADTIRRRCEEPDSVCDERLEPLGRAAIRILRGRLARRLPPRAAAAMPLPFKPLRPRQLPAQIGRARLLLALLRRPPRPGRALASPTAPFPRAWRTTWEDGVATPLANEGAADPLSAPASL